MVAEQFDADGNASVSTLFAGRIFKVVYHNQDKADFGAYHIRRVSLDGRVIEGEWQSQAALSRSVLTPLSAGEPHRIDVELAANNFKRK